MKKGNKKEPEPKKGDTEKHTPKSPEKSSKALVPVKAKKVRTKHEILLEMA
jgi:hypothetical protein